MTWQNKEGDDEVRAVNTHIITIPTPSINSAYPEDQAVVRTITCPSCGHSFEIYDHRHHHQGLVHDDLLRLPGGVKFDPTDQEILKHLEGKVGRDGDDARKKNLLHPLIDQFIPTLEGEDGICCTHPESLPGVCKDGQIRHFFHRPSKAYTTGNRKRRKVQKNADGSETRWHKTGKTRPILVGGVVRGFKKILVLYTNYGRQRKPEKTNWVMHQYHVGNNEEERDGELVASKVFYQTQPRQSAGSTTGLKDPKDSQSIKRKRLQDDDCVAKMSSNYADYYDDQNCSVSYDQLISNFSLQGEATRLDTVMAD